jgi:hypothetical protein
LIKSVSFYIGITVPLLIVFGRLYSTFFESHLPESFVSTMSVVISTPTGKIGALLTQILLNAGEKVTVVARDPTKVSSEVMEADDNKFGIAGEEFRRSGSSSCEGIFYGRPIGYR